MLKLLSGNQGAECLRLMWNIENVRARLIENLSFFLKLSSKQGVCSNICCIIYFRCERISPMNYLSSSMCESSILFFFFGCSFEGEISFTSNKKNYLWGKWNLGRFNKIRKCEKWKLFLLAWLLHLSLLRVWYHSLVMEQFKRYIWEQETLSCFLPN